MAKRKKPAYYAVRVGRVPGVYRTWDECRAQTNGHSGAVFKGFGSEAEAKSFVAAASSGGSRGGATTTAKRARRAERSPQTDVPDPSHRSTQPTDTVADGDGDTEGVAYSSFARRMMAKMGHKDGEGLGKEGRTGITSPVKANGTGGNCKHGVGYGTEKLSDKQAEALRLIRAGSNVFVTGVAGTGKSLLLRRAIAHMERTYGPDEWVAVGPTGPTAVAIGGQTIHSFAGIGVPKVHDDFNKAWDRKREWRRLRAMVIDEVSMISAEFFDALSDVVGRIRGGDGDDGREAFGGIQLVVCGDFLQLPPIPPRITDVREMRAALSTQRATSHKKLFLNRGFAFQSTHWKKAGFSVVQLDRVFRQKNSSFVRVLQEIREGRVSSDAEAFLRSCSRPLPPNEFGVRPTVLHSTNGDVTRENMRELDMLPGDDVHEFVAVDGIELEEDAPGWASDNLRNNQFFKSCIAEKVLKLKVGAQVMLVKNEQNNSDDRCGRARLVNGSRGKVIGFKVFKDRVGVEEGSDDGEDEDEDEEVLESLQADESGLPGVDTYPIVQFLDGRKRLIRAQMFESRLVGLGSCTRIAIPLRLAWAITTHKSQGLTLDHVIADVGGVFTEAQAYVALSRASDENGLELRNFDRSKVRANRLALSFYSDPNADFPHWDDEQRRSSSEIETETATPEGRPDCLQGMAFVFSGVLNSLEREAAEALVKKHGGVVRGAVSGKTNFLVIGDKMEDGRDTTSGTKYGKAMQIINGGKNKSDLQVIDEEGLLRLIR